VLAMDTAYPGCKMIERREWLIRAVENEVSGVEVYAEVRPVYLVQEPQQHFSRLLAGFQVERQALLRTAIRDFLHGFDEIGVIGPTLRKDADVGRQRRRTDLRG